MPRRFLLAAALLLLPATATAERSPTFAAAPDAGAASVTDVPEPASFALMACGLAALVFVAPERREDT
jgi:hypothetical protein